MSAEPANNESTFEEVIEVLEPHASVIKLALALFAFAFVGVSIFKSSGVSANHLSILPWRAMDINTSGGSQEPVTGGFDVTASGSDIWWTSDSFRYLYQTAPTGDFTMTAKVAWISNTDSWAKAGVMVRATTAANSPYMFMLVTPVNNNVSNGADLQYRGVAGQFSGHDGENRTPSLNRWLRISRTGSTYKAYISSDGVNFTQYGTSKSFNLGSTPFVGLASTSHKASAYANVQFKDVNFTVSSSTVQPPAPPLPASSNVDDDGDGFSNNAEGWIGTDRSAACPTSVSHKAWPPDINNDGAVTMADIDIVKNPAWFNSAWGDGRFQARYDLNVDGKINVLDISTFFAPIRYLDKKCASQTPTPIADLRPDLKVTNLSLSSASVTANQAVTATVSVQNRGLKLSPCGGYGDVDMNGGINYSDSQLILRYTAGETTLLSGEKLVRANVNGGVVNSTDALEVMRFYEGQITTFQAVCGTIAPPTQPSSGPFLYTFYNNASSASCNSAGQNSASIPRLRAGESTSFNVSFNAPASAGPYSALIFADSSCIVNETDNNNNQATASYSVIQPCTGTPVLQVVPVSVERGKNIELSAGGLSNCSSSDVIKFDSTMGGGVWDKPLVNCNLGLAGNGQWECSSSFTADWNPGGPYSVRALLDRGNNGSIEAMSNVVNVTVTAPLPPPSPTSGGGVTGSQDKWGFREYAKTNPYFQRDIQVPNYGPANLGMFLYGLAGCESTWTSSSDGYFKGLHQYLLSTWAASNTRRLGYIPNVYDGYIQMDNTAWMIVEGGYGINGQWPGCTDGGAVYPREWTWFLDEW